jgi:hypothetical protein
MVSLLVPSPPYVSAMQTQLKAEYSSYIAKQRQIKDIMNAFM